MTGRFFWFGVLLSLCSCYSVPDDQCDIIVDSQINDGSADIDIVELYARAQGATDWGENLLSEGDLLSANGGQQLFGLVEEGTTWELRGIDADGNSYTLSTPCEGGESYELGFQYSDLD